MCIYNVNILLYVLYIYNTCIYVYMCIYTPQVLASAVYRQLCFLRFLLSSTECTVLSIYAFISSLHASKIEAEACSRETLLETY